MTKLNIISDDNLNLLRSYRETTLADLGGDVDEPVDEVQAYKIGAFHAFSDSLETVEEKDDRTPINDKLLKAIIAVGTVSVVVYVGKKLDVKDKAKKLYGKLHSE